MKIEQSKAQDIVSWLAVVLTTIVAFFCTYYFSLSGAVQGILWIFWLVLILLFGYFTRFGKNTFSFAQEAKAEMLKVVWPTRQETIQTTTIVMAMVTITGFILWGVDSAMMWAIAKITHLG